MWVHEIQFDIICQTQLVSVFQVEEDSNVTMGFGVFSDFDFSTVNRDLFCSLLIDHDHILQCLLAHSSAFRPHKLICSSSSFTATGSVYLSYIPKPVCGLWFLHKVLFYTFLNYLRVGQISKHSPHYGLIVMWVKVQVQSYCLSYCNIQRLFGFIDQNHCLWNQTDFCSN